MPFKNNAQMRACFAKDFAAKGKSTWNCDEMLGKRKVTHLYYGKRGGLYLFLADNTKVHVPVAARSYVLKKYKKLPKLFQD